VPETKRIDRGADSKFSPEYWSMVRLRYDAIDRGLYELSIVYGMSAIRLANEELAAMIKAIKNA
jgi:hypothetical protein